MSITQGSIQKTDVKTLDTLISKFSGSSMLFTNCSSSSIIIDLDEIQNQDDEGQQPGLYLEVEEILLKGMVNINELTDVTYLELYN
jgi:hypothetical protein